MIRKIDEASTDSWLQRTTAAGGPEADTREEAASAARAPTERSHEGWDPMEVWLRRIDQPRRLRQQVTPTDTRRRG